MKFLTYCDSNYKNIGDITIPLMSNYCKRHNIDFVLHREITSEHFNVYWHKLSIIRNSLVNTDWVIWCDADILIQNLDFCWNKYLKNKNDKNLIISSDHRGLCLGFFLLRGCSWSLKLFESMELLGNIKETKIGLYDVKNQREQDTLKVLVDFFGNIGDRVDLIPESIISNPRSKVNESPRFAHHFWANRDLNRVVNELKIKTNIQSNNA